MALKRSLTLIELTLMGVGMILGAGIYVLVGSAAEQAGPALWMAFAVAGFISMLTGLSYAELASMRPDAGSSFNYVKEAFKSDKLAFISGWVFSASTIIAATTVSLGFARYVNSLGLNIDLVLSALFIIAVGIALNLWGIEKASKANEAATLLEMLGLLIVIGIGFFLTNPQVSLELPANTEGFLNAVALAFFAFIGFEVIANQAGEAKNPARDIPLALVLAIVISAALYGLTAVAFTSMASPEQIAEFNAKKIGALSAAASGLAGPWVLVALALIALFSTGNTVLLSITTASRMIYGMSEKNALPKIFGATKAGTPGNAILIAGAGAAVLLFFSELNLVANATVLGMLYVFGMDNLAVIKLRFDEPKVKRPFKVPIAIGKYPIPAVIGVLSCAALFTYTATQQPMSLLILAVFCAIGLALETLKENSVKKNTAKRGKRKAKKALTRKKR